MAENEFKVTMEIFKYRFLDFTQTAIWYGEEEENVFAVLGDHMKHRFFDLTKVEFWVCQEAENAFLTSIPPLESSLIFCLLTSPKCDTVEVEKAIIHVVDLHFEVIFCFSTNRKCDFFKLIGQRFKWSNGT